MIKILRTIPEVDLAKVLQHPVELRHELTRRRHLYLIYIVHNLNELKAHNSSLIIGRVLARVLARVRRARII